MGGWTDGTARVAELEQDRRQQAARLQQQTGHIKALERQFFQMAAILPPEGRTQTVAATR
jgi:hypothetical protein